MNRQAFIKSPVVGFSGVEAIAQAAHADQQARFRRIGLDLAPQVEDVLVDGAVGDRDARPPRRARSAARG